MDPWKLMLLFGGILNIFGGFISLMWPKVFKCFDEDFDPLSNPMIGLFSAGVAMAFGGGYIYTYFWEPHNLSLLMLGVSVRCWAFISSFYCFRTGKISRKLFLLVGLEAILFAVAFVIYAYQRRDILTWS